MRPEPEDLLTSGTWITAPDDGDALRLIGRVSLQFTPRGNLIHTAWKDGREVVRFLQYRTDGNALITIDDAPRAEEHLDFRFLPDGTLAIVDGGVAYRYVRGEPNRSFDASSALLDLAILGLRSGTERVSVDDRLRPFVLAETDSERSFADFDQDDRKEAVDAARRTMRGLGETVRACVLVYDGVLALGPRRFEAVFAEASETSSPHGIVLAQRYRRRKIRRTREMVGPIAYCGRTERLLAGPPAS